MRSIDINCDMGESTRQKKVGNDHLIMPWISSCNLACGFHGGDPLTIQNTIELALRHNVRIGAHPSYHDTENFGRQAMSISQDELSAILKYQILALKGMVELLGGTLHHVKPHGALYHACANDKNIALLMAQTVFLIDPKIIIYGIAGNLLWKTITEETGLRFVPEAFADRNYNENGTLVSRQSENAMIHSIDASLQQSLQIMENEVRPLNGKLFSIKAETICIHGDEPSAPELAKRLQQELRKNGYEIKAP